MNKPIKPIKPCKNDKPPKKQLLLQKWICVDGGGDVFLRPVKYNQYGYIDSYRGNDLYPNDSIAFYQLTRLRDLVGKDYDLTSIVDENYHEGWVVSWGEENKDYEKELKAFEKRFGSYSYNLKKYEDEMNLYNIWKKEQEIEELKKKIKIKEKEIKR